MTRAVLALAALAITLPLAPKGARGRQPEREKPEPRRLPDGAAPKGLSVARVDVAFRGDRALVTTDLTWPRRGAPDGFSLHVAYGAPGAPRAFDAELLSVPGAGFSPALEARGAPLTASHEPRAPREAAVALGPRAVAGRLVVVPQDEEARVTTPQVALRLRAVVELPPAARAGVLVRIGPEDATLDLGPVTVTVDGVASPRARAALCDDGRRTPIALPGRAELPSPARVARRAGESLCVDLDPLGPPPAG